MQILLVLNDPPYGTERCYNGLRLALALPGAIPLITVAVFLMAGAVTAAESGMHVFGQAVIGSQALLTFA